jgi:hypothetical protein
MSAYPQVATPLEATVPPPIEAPLPRVRQGGRYRFGLILFVLGGVIVTLFLGLIVAAFPWTRDGSPARVVLSVLTLAMVWGIYRGLKRHRLALFASGFGGFVIAASEGGLFVGNGAIVFYVGALALMSGAIILASYLPARPPRLPKPVRLLASFVGYLFATTFMIGGAVAVFQPVP